MITNYKKKYITLSCEKMLYSENNYCIFTAELHINGPIMNHYNRLNELLIEYAVLSQNKTVPNLEKTEYADLVDFCISNNDFEHGLKIVDSAILLFPSALEFVVQKIEIFLRLNEPEQALALLESVEDLHRLSRQAKILKAKALKATGNNKAALDIIDELESSTKDAFDIYELKASLLENLEQFGNLYQVTKGQILTAPKEQVDALLEKFSFFTEITSNYLDAIQFYNQVIDQHPFSSTVWQNLGETHGMLGNCEEAVDAFEFCMAINPRNRIAYFGAARCLEKAGRFDLALNYYDEYLETSQLDDAEALVNVANCFYQMEDLDTAKHRLLESIQIDPELPEAFAILGEIYAETNNPKKAIDCYKEAMDIDPFNEEYIIDFANLYFSLGEIEKAKQLFQQAIDTAPDILETWLPYISFLINTQEHQLLLESLDEVSTYFNEDKVIYLKVAVLFAAGKRKEAKYWLAEALATYGESFLELLFDISPALAMDQEIMDIIKKYQ